MTEYIYFVKCPNCEDEPFEFFNEAKNFALSHLSDKPVITQTEVCRNDFGECTDSTDLGQIWSWEDMMQDTATDGEPAKVIFTRDDLKDYIPDEDTEFNNLDNSVDFTSETFEISAIDSIPDNFRKPSAESDMSKEDEIRDLAQEMYSFGVECGSYEEFESFMLSNNDVPTEELYNIYKGTLDSLARKPIPEGMTIEQLVEEMEENEDTVECAVCNELYNKDSCHKEAGRGYVCESCSSGIKESLDVHNKVDLDYGDYYYTTTVDDIITAIWENFITEEDVKDIPGGLDAVNDYLINDSAMWDKFWNDYYDELFGTYEEEIYNYFDKWARAKYREEQRENRYEDEIGRRIDYEYEMWKERQYDESVESNNQKPVLEEFDEVCTPLTACPECGLDESFDHIAGTCNKCGFSL